MDTHSIKVNYHSCLVNIEGSIDPIIQKMREQDKQPWRSMAWKGPLVQMLQSVKHLKIITTIKWSSLPFVGPAIGVVVGSFNVVPLWGIICAALVLTFLAYFILVKIYERKMALIGDACFHVEAFKMHRRDEYERIWSHFVNTRDFNFKGLARFVDNSFSSSDDGKIDRVVSFTSGQLEQYKTSIAELKETIKIQNEAISSLEDDLEQTETAVEYLVGLLKKINENLYRFVNNKLQYHDLDFVTGFSLYKKVNNQLHMILDKGTTGVSPSVLDLTHSNRPYAAVDAVNSGSDDAFTNNPFPGRIIVAFRMKMLNNETWVWCFHFDEDDKRALSLIQSNDIIEAKQIRNMIHAFCLVLQKRMLADKEVDPNAIGE